MRFGQSFLIGTGMLVSVAGGTLQTYFPNIPTINTIFSTAGTVTGSRNTRDKKRFLFDFGFSFL